MLKPKPVEIPEKVFIEMTPKLYNDLKEYRLRSISPVIRGHINTYFEWLKSIQPEEVVDAIDKGITPAQAYKNLGLNPIRFGIAAARGFLKVAPKYKQQLKEVATLDLALTTLKYENPSTYAILKKYGKKGEEFLLQWIQGAFGILGVK